MESFIDNARFFLQSRGADLITCIVGVVFGLLIINNVMRLLKRALINTRMDVTIVKLSLTMLKVTLYFMLLLYAIGRLGIKLTGFIAVFSAFSLAFGLAIQDVISGVANGIVIVSSKPFKVGDHVKVGSVEGIIREIRIMHTVIDTFDKVQIFIPNKTVYNAEILNFSADPIRRLDFIVSVDYDTDMTKAREVMLEAAKSYPLVLKKPDPTVAIKEFCSSDVSFIIKAWVRNEDYWTMFNDFKMVLFNTFKKEGIVMAFPQVTLSQREPLKLSLDGLKVSAVNKSTHTGEEK